MPSPYLTDEELTGICRPLTQPAAMARYLKSQGFHVKCRPDGWPLVSRENYNTVMMGQAPTSHAQSEMTGPNVEALLDRFKNKGASYAHGKTEKKQSARAA